MISFVHDSRQLAELYEQTSDLQLESGKRLVERLGPGPGARVLDVGCGTGRLTRWIAERVGPNGSVVGIDPLEERIAIALSHGGAFEVGRAEDLGAFDDASFDAVCLSSVFHWVSDKARALAEIRRVLRPGGRVAMTTPAQELSRAGTVALVLQPLLQRYGAAAALGKRGCTVTELVSLVLASGLELVELHVTQESSRHESGEAFVDFAEASAFGNLLGLAPEERRAAFRAELVSAFERHRGPQGVVVRGWGTLFVAERLT